MEYKNIDKVKLLLSELDNIDNAREIINKCLRDKGTSDDFKILGFYINNIIRYIPRFGNKLKDYFNDMENDIDKQLKDL